MNEKRVLNVLIACEESQAVCKEFRALGHRAFSCDVQDCSGGFPEWHVKGDVFPLLNGDCTFKTSDSHTHTQRGPWDLLIAHPPCTYLSNAGAARLYKVIDGKTYIERDRFEKGMDAKESGGYKKASGESSFAHSCTSVYRVSSIFQTSPPGPRP